MKMTQDDKALVSPRGPSFTMLAAVFLISACVLLLEIAFTRILSVILSYHYVFAVISMALLGLGAGGILAYLTRSRMGWGSLPFLAVLFGLSIPLSVIGVVRLPGVGLLLYALIIVVPFILAGFIQSRVFQEFAGQSGKVYAADLIGAAAGALLAVPLLNWSGAVIASIVIGIAGAGSSALFSTRTFRRRLWTSSVTLAPIATLLVSLLVPNLVDIPLSSQAGKELAYNLQNNDLGGQLVASRWSSFGRTDLVGYKNNPDLMVLFVDATAGSAMYRFTGDINNPGPAVVSLKTAFPGYFPLQYLQSGQKDNALIIGPGGGRDVLAALMAGIKDITAVEVNPDTVDLVKKYSDFNGGIYTDFPNVNVVAAEGRNYLRQQTNSYDVIMLSLPVTKTSRSPEGFALTEAFLFTKDSVADYFDHLSPEGRLVVVTHSPEEVIRLVSLSHAALEERGLSDTDVMERIFTVGSRHGGSVFVLGKSKINPNEIYQEHQALHLSKMEPEVSYFPYVRQVAGIDHVEQKLFDQCEMLSPVLTEMGHGYLSNQDMVSGFAAVGYDMSAVTDERPFFYNFELGIPDSLYLLLMLSLLFVLGVIFLPSRFMERKQESGRKVRRNRARGPGVYRFLFALLGIGFMLAEIPLIQRFTLFLGEPVLSVTVLLFSILLGAGIGGFISGRISQEALPGKIGLFALGIALVLFAYAFLTPWLLKQWLGLSLPARALVSLATLMPLGFVLGFPFPLAMRLMQKKELERYVPWMWGINGTASVLGSILAIVLAMKFGFAAVMIIGAACYFLSWFVSRGWISVENVADS